MVAARGTSALGEKVMDIELAMPSGETVKDSIHFGELRKIPLPERKTAEATIRPAKSYDVGAGPGKDFTCTIEGGVVGIILDGRGRPLALPEKREDSKKLLMSWWNAMGLYQDGYMELVQK